MTGPTERLLTLADVGATVRVRVTAYNGAGGSSATSPPSEVVDATLPAGGAASVNLELDARTEFDPFAGYSTWISAHVDLLRGYPPFSDVYIPYGVPVIAYHDYYTEYTQAGKPLCIKANRESFIAKVTRDRQHGYAGTFLDDANFAGGNIPGSQECLAQLIEEERTAIGPSGILQLNAQYHDIWPLMKAGNPYVGRALAVTNLMHKEFGVGPTSGISTAGDYGEMLQYTDALLAKGIHTVMATDWHAPAPESWEYNLATYFLLNGIQGDYFVGDAPNELPPTLWPGYAITLGEPTGVRERLSGGIWRRRFAGGVVYVAEPGASTQTIPLGKAMHSVHWGDVSSVTLKSGQGAVLVG